MGQKVLVMDDALWLKFKKLCALNEKSMKDEVTSFVKGYIVRYGGLIK